MDYTKEELQIQYYNILNNKSRGFKHNSLITEDNRRYILYLFIKQLFKDNIISNIEELPKVVSNKLFKKYKIFQLVKEYYNSSPITVVNLLYPNKWNFWDFNIHVPNGYWNDKNNIKLAVKDLILNKNKYKNIPEDIFLLTEYDFEKYKLCSILNIYHYNIPQLLQDVFPEYDLPTWRFKRVGKGYWSKKENRISGLKDFIENYMKIPIKDIPKVLTSGYIKINAPKLLNVYDTYYAGSLYSWVNEIYPNKFKLEDFSENIGDDGKKLASREELLIHNLLLKHFNKVDYFENTNDKNVKLYNSDCSESYVPDWILNDKIIVEYFGLYAPHRKTKFSQKYKLRTENKIKFYKKYCDKNSQYFFIPLFPDDLKENLDGIKQKLLIL